MQSSICEISPAGVGKVEVIGKVRESTEFSSLFMVSDLSSLGQIKPCKDMNVNKIDRVNVGYKAAK